MGGALPPLPQCAFMAWCSVGGAQVTQSKGAFGHHAQTNSYNFHSATYSVDTADSSSEGKAAVA